jgi:hypothetical protein
MTVAPVPSTSQAQDLPAAAHESRDLPRFAPRLGREFLEKELRLAHCSPVRPRRGGWLGTQLQRDDSTEASGGHRRGRARGARFWPTPFAMRFGVWTALRRVR